MSGTVGVSAGLIATAAGVAYDYLTSNTTMPYTKPKQSTTWTKKRRLQRKRKTLYKKRAAFKKRKTYSGKRTTAYKKISKRLRDITRTLKSDQARHTHRRREVLKVETTVSKATHTVLSHVSCDQLESIMANLRYYNPAVPGTLTTADASSGSYTRQVHFENVCSKLTVRNNYQIPAKVTIYLCTPRADTDLVVTQFYTAGAADQTIGPIATDSPLLYMSDIKLVAENWSVKRVGFALLEPGQEMHHMHSTGPFDYDPSNFDTHTMSYQKKYKNYGYCIRIEGPFGHDNTAAQYTTLQAAVDTYLDNKYVMTYDAGVNLDDYSEDNNASAVFTNIGLVSNKAVADNQGYSVS